MTLVIEYKGDLFEPTKQNTKKPDTYIGRVSHRLTVIAIYTRVTPGKSRDKFCLCNCECGNTKIVSARGIRSQRIKSCGCWKSEVDTSKAKSMGDANKSHGMSGTRLYSIWDGIRHRCDNPKSSGYESYGGRGIGYDPRWKDFEAFYTDMKDGYEEHLTIERIDVDGAYTKENCTWVENEEQAWNRRGTIRVDVEGTLYTLKELAEHLNIPHKALYQRVRLGWTTEEILNTPHGKRRRRD